MSSSDDFSLDQSPTRELRVPLSYSHSLPGAPAAVTLPDLESGNDRALSAVSSVPSTVWLGGLEPPTLSKQHDLHLTNLYHAQESFQQSYHSSKSSTLSLSSTFSSLSFEHDLIPLPTPSQAPDDYLTPNSHFFIYGPSSCCTTFFQLLQSTLTSFGVECVPLSDFSLDCTFGHLTATRIDVSLFACKQPNKYAVDFQRISGNAFDFFQLYRNVIAKLMEHNEYELQSSVQPVCSPLDYDSLAPPTLHSHSRCHNAFSGEQLHVSIRALINMCASNCQDIKMHGINTLAQLSTQADFLTHLNENNNNSNNEQSHPFQQLLIDEGCKELIHELLSQNCEEISRASLQFLVNMSVDRAFCSWLLSSPSVCSVLSLAQSPCVTLVRDAAAILHNCITALGAQSFVAAMHEGDKAALATCLKHLSSSSDPSCINTCDNMRNIFGQEQFQTLMQH